MSPTLPSTSTAAVFTGPNQSLELREIPVPSSLGPGELLVRVSCCTICGSDLHTVSGRRGGPAPCVLGHEIVGTVAAVGEPPPLDLRGTSIQVGDRVVWSVAVACKRCRNCRRGLPQKCAELRKYGHHAIETGWQLSGGLAEHCHLLAGTDALIVDSTVVDQVIAPAACATATVAAALRMADQRGGTAQGGGRTQGDGKTQRRGPDRLRSGRVLIIGAGMLGLTAAALSRERGAEAVVVADIDPQRLALSREFGCDDAFLFDELVERGEPAFDCVFEMSGTPAGSQAAIELAGIGASIVLVGAVLPTATIPIEPEKIVRRLLSIHGVHNYAPEDLIAAVDFLLGPGRQYPFAGLVARVFPLDDVNQALQYASRSKPIRVAIDPAADT